MDKYWTMKLLCRLDQTFSVLYRWKKSVHTCIPNHLSLSTLITRRVRKHGQMLDDGIAAKTKFNLFSPKLLDKSLKVVFTIILAHQFSSLGGRIYKEKSLRRYHCKLLIICSLNLALMTISTHDLPCNCAMHGHTGKAHGVC